MSELLIQETATVATPAAGKVKIYADNSATPCVRARDDAGNDKALFGVSNQSVAAQVLAVARTYLIGSALAVPKNKLQIGTCFRWTFDIVKTAAGVAASTYDICVGTLGTTGDAARVAFTKPAGTAVIDTGRIAIEAIVRGPLSAVGVVVGHFNLTHNLQITGHAIIPCVDVTTISAGFDVTVADLIVGICVTGGASDAVTVQLVQAMAWNL